MHRRTFLAALAGALAAPLAVGRAHAASLRASTVLEGAERYLGIPYVYGGNDPQVGLDCSSYVSLAWQIPLCWLLQPSVAVRPPVGTRGGAHRAGGSRSPGPSCGSAAAARSRRRHVAAGVGRCPGGGGCR
jgi:hypothetical protein